MQRRACHWGCRRPPVRLLRRDDQRTDVGRHFGRMLARPLGGPLSRLPSRHGGTADASFIADYESNRHDYFHSAIWHVRAVSLSDVCDTQPIILFFRHTPAPLCIRVVYVSNFVCVCSFCGTSIMLSGAFVPTTAAPRLHRPMKRRHEADCAVAVAHSSVSTAGPSSASDLPTVPFPSPLDMLAYAAEQLFTPSLDSDDESTDPST